MVFAWRARGVNFVSRCGGRRSIRAHHCAPFVKRCTMMRSSPPFAAAAARKSHASRAPCEHRT
eukprot:8390745-Lingulodinium_polyedra.AAC.1